MRHGNSGYKYYFYDIQAKLKRIKSIQDKKIVSYLKIVMYEG